LSTSLYSYESVPTIRRFTHSEARHRIVVGPFRSGKSSGMLMELIYRGQQQIPDKKGIRRTRFAIVRNTFRQLESTTMRTVFQWFPPGEYGMHRVADHQYFLDQWPGVRIEFDFMALDRPDHVKNLLSMEVTGVWINEGREIVKEIWDGLDGRIGQWPPSNQEGCTWAGIIMDTNPPNEGHWIHKLIEEDKPANMESFIQPSGLSPEAENLINLRGGQKYYQDLAIGKSPEYINVYIHGNYGFTMSGTPVYASSYSDSIHCADKIIQPNKNLPIVTGWDFYLHPALVIGQLSPRGELVILDELMGTGMGAERFINELVEPLLNSKYRGMSVVGYGDPTGSVRAQSDESDCYQVLKKHNFHWIKECHTNATMPRIGAVEYYLTRLVDGAQPAFQLSPNCQMLREGFNGGYRRKEDGEIDKKNPYSHCHDSLQYLSLYTLWKHNRAAANSLPTKRNRTPQHQPASSAGY
jgi:hypothetical protein